MRSVQTAHRSLLKAIAESGGVEDIEIIQAAVDGGAGGPEMTGETVASLLSMQQIQDDLILTPEFLDNVVVPLMVSSAEGLTERQAKARIEKHTFRAGDAEELFAALQDATRLWEESAEDPEALDEAVKKLPAAAKAASK
jgi:hypothetical protein